MNENKYFTPDIEDISVGCEFEMDDTWGGWKKLTLTKELLANSLVGLGSGNERAPWYHKIRVPYLTKEQIEAEGWKETSKYNYEKTASNITSYYGDDCYLWIMHPATTVLGEKYLANSFKGECKDINTFRKICKLLNI